MSDERVHTFRWDDPAAIAGGAKGKSGYEYLSEVLDGKIPHAPILTALGIRATVVEKGHIRLAGTPHEYMYNPMNVVHGGIACLLLDTAMGGAVMTVLDDRTTYTTVALTVHLSRPITMSTGPFVADGRIITRGLNIATAEGRMVDMRDRLLAHATGTCLLSERS